MWPLSGNEKTQEQLDAYPRKLMFSKDDDTRLTKRTVTLASVIYRMIFLKQPTYYVYPKGQSTPGGSKYTHQCEGTRRRSVEDIYSVAKNYVKKGLTREQVEQAMDKLIAAKLISQSFCGQVLRRVHIPAKAGDTIKLQHIKDALKNG